MEIISFKIFLYLIIILSAVFHEYAHSLMAYKLGDTTAKDSGRLTLNPLVHLDLWGTVIIPLFLLFTSGIFIGWAKPVPYNPYNLRDQKYGSLKVALAGPGANLLLAIILGLPLRFLSLENLTLSSNFLSFLFYLKFIVYINIFLALFNLIPFPPLDGSKIFFTLFPSSLKYFLEMGFLGIFLALILAFFILSPIANLLFWIITGQGFYF